MNELKEVTEEDCHRNYISLNNGKTKNFEENLFKLFFHFFDYKFGCSLSTIRREWRNIHPNVRRGRWQVDEDEVQIILMQKNFFSNHFKQSMKIRSFSIIGAAAKCIKKTIESRNN